MSSRERPNNFECFSHKKKNRKKKLAGKKELAGFTMWSSKRHLFVDLASDSPSSTGPVENIGTVGTNSFDRYCSPALKSRGY